MKNFDFYKELYFKEQDRRQEVTNALNIPLALITGLASGFFFFITSFDYKNPESFLILCFIIFSSLVAFCLVKAIFYLIKAFGIWNSKYEYKALPFVNNLYKWHSSLYEYYEDDENVTDINNHINNVFQDETICIMNECTNHNSLVNDQKHEYIHNAKIFIIYCIVLQMITGFVFGYNHFNKKTKIHKIEIVKNKK